MSKFNDHAKQYYYNAPAFKPSIPEAVIARHVLVLEREPIIASDMRQEVSALDPEVRVHVAPSIRDALVRAGDLGRIDLLIVSQRSATYAEDPAFPELARTSQALMLLGDEDFDWLKDYSDVHVARTPFTSESLRSDLMAVTVAGVPLFRQRSLG